MPRTENEIRKDLEKARAEYRLANETQPASATLPLSQKVKTLMKELSAKLSEGAKPCPKCGQLPHGMKRPQGKKKGIVLTLYEVGCLNVGCEKDGFHMRSIAATPAEAVEAWNREEYFKGE